MEMGLSEPAVVLDKNGMAFILIVSTVGSGFTGTT